MMTTDRRIILDHFSGTTVTRQNPGMTSRDFIYWLQGFFEILGETPALTEVQLKIIRDHIGYISQKSPFMHWLEGMLDGAPVDMSPKIAARLKDEFQHMTAPAPSLTMPHTVPVPSNPPPYVSPHHPWVTSGPLDMTVC